VSDPIVDDLLELFGDSIAVAARTAVNGYGLETFGADEDLACHITGRVMRIQDSEGIERVSKLQAIFAGAHGLTTTHRYTLPVEYSANPANALDMLARQPKAMAVRQYSDENGPHHETVYF
jgi:hypothetical protein